MLQAQIAAVGVEVISTVKEELSNSLENAKEDTLEFMQKNCDIFMEAVNLWLDNYTLLNLKAARPEHLPTGSNDDKDTTEDHKEETSEKKFKEKDESKDATDNE